MDEALTKHLNRQLEAAQKRYEETYARLVHLILGRPFTGTVGTTLETNAIYMLTDMLTTKQKIDDIKNILDEIQTIK